MKNTFSPEVIFSASKSMNRFGLELRGGRRYVDGHIDAFQGVSTKELMEGEFITPMMILDDNEAVTLMDALWSAGVRPSNGEGNVGQIGAIKAHLEDMRTLVFNARGLPK